MSKIIHGKKLFDGKFSARELWQISIGKKCTGCGAPAETILSTLVGLEDLKKRRPDVVGAMMAKSDSGTSLPIIKTIHGHMVCVGEAYACSGCLSTVEKVAAQGQRAWEKRGIMCHVEIKRGPEKDKPLVPVPGEVEV